MFVSAATSGVFSAPLKARYPRRPIAQDSGVSSGLSISPLRASGGPPSIFQSAPKRTPSLVAPPKAGGGMLFQLQGSSRNSSPLMVGVRASHRTQAVPMGRLQSSQSDLLSSLRKIDRSSRLIQANASPFRQQGGFGAQLGTSSLSLLG